MDVVKSEPEDAFPQAVSVSQPAQKTPDQASLADTRHAMDQYPGLWLPEHGPFQFLHGALPADETIVALLKRLLRQRPFRTRTDGLSLFNPWKHGRTLLVENRHQPILQRKFTEDADPSVLCQHGTAAGSHGPGDITGVDKFLVKSREKLPGAADVKVVSHGNHAADSRLEQGRGNRGKGVFRLIVDTCRLTGIEHHYGDAVFA